VRRLEAAVLGVVLAVLAIGLAVALLLPPPFTSVASATYSELPDEQAAELAQAARRFVVSGDGDAKATLNEVMTLEAVSHLDDVRRVIAGANAATALLALLAAAWVGLAVYQRRLGTVAAALRIGAALAAGLVVAIAVFAAIDFGAFFSAFHALFFAPGTWVFPSDSVLIRLFPEPFWVAAGIAWGVLICVLAGVYAILAWAISAGERNQRGGDITL
jgi:integral membrane protein (TIGR01906 family)